MTPTPPGSAAWTGGAPPPPPPPPPGDAGAPPVPPPPGSGPRGDGRPGPTADDRVVYRYGSAPSDRLPGASFASRAAAFLLDSVVVLALPIAAVVVLQTGPSQIQTCEITEDGTLAVFQEGAVTGLCEVPTTATFGVAGVLAALGILVWFAYVAHEGRTTQTLGKRLLRIRTVDARTGEPIGAGRNIGRNLIRGLLTAFFVPFVIDHLWPLWDRDGQALHDKATSAAVVPVQPS